MCHPFGNPTSVATNDPSVHAVAFTRTPDNPFDVMYQIPGAVAVDAGVVLATGMPLIAAQFVLSTVASNVTVPVNVPTSCTAVTPFTVSRHSSDTISPLASIVPLVLFR
jgi:hypothetical protein